MILNCDLIEQLFERLPNEQQHALIEELFKKSRQSISYFRRTPNITIAKLDILARHFGMPWDAFRNSNKYFHSISTGDGCHHIASISINDNHAEEVESLTKQLKAEKEKYEQLKKDKEEIIEMQKAMIEMLKAQLAAATAK